MKPVNFTPWNTIRNGFWGIIAIVWFSVSFPAAATEQIYLGPPKSGAAAGGAAWFTGQNGGGSTFIDWADPSSSGFDFTISNTVAGKGNNGDWRCPAFSLGPAAGGARPITFSFVYKMVDPAVKGNNIHVQLRFFDATGTNFISEIVLRIGSHTSDSKMTDYKTLSIENIIAPRKAKTADIWVDANIFEPWVCGIARFGDFSVTTVPRSLSYKAGVLFAVLVGIGVLFWLLVWLWQQFKPV